MDGKVWVVSLRIWELLEHLRRWNKGWWFCSLLQNSLTLCYTLKEDFSRPIETSQAQVIIKVTLMNRTSQLTRSSEMNIAPLIKQSALIHISLDQWSSRTIDQKFVMSNPLSYTTQIRPFVFRFVSFKWLQDFTGISFNAHKVCLKVSPVDR